MIIQNTIDMNVHCEEVAITLWMLMPCERVC